MKLKLNVLSQPQPGITFETLSSVKTENLTSETEITPSTKPPPVLNILRPSNIKAEIVENIPVTFDETKILKSYMMYNGESKNVEDLIVGDELMGADSKPCKILSIDKVREKSYLVTPVKGEDFIIGESEILSLTYCGNNRVVWEEGRNACKVLYFDISNKRQNTKYFLTSDWNGKEKSYEAANNYLKEIGNNNYFEIFVPEFINSARNEDFKIYKVGLDFLHTEFEIDPYIIGMWLGDGSHAAPHITSADPEIVDYFREYFADFGLIVHSNGISHGISTGKNQGYPGRNLFLNYLRNINIFKNKHIPIQFLLTSRENRLRLLAGLLDSDGSLASNCYDFIQKRERLFDGVIFLARSLGFSCYKKPCVKICTNAPGGPKAGNYFRCNISGEGLEEIPTLLNRKKAHERKQIKRAYVNGIILKYVGENEIYRIVTHTTKFLMSDFTVRHRYETTDNNDDKKVIVLKKDKITNLPYGYKKENNGIGIRIEEAIIIRRIFKEVNNGKTLKKIAVELNSENIKTRHDANFSDSTVSHIISLKEKYLGETTENEEIWPQILSDDYKKETTKKKQLKYGYMKSNGQIAIDENEAKIIRHIFNEHKNKVSYNKIATQLNSLKLKTKKGKTWTTSTINGILTKKSLGALDYPVILDKSLFA
jgi:hypothetical protein